MLSTKEKGLEIWERMAESLQSYTGFRDVRTQLWAHKQEDSMRLREN